VLYLSFLLCLTSVALTSKEEELRQINVGHVGPTLLQLLTAGLAGAGTVATAGALLSGGIGLLGGKGKHGKDGLFGKHGIFGKHGKHGKGKKRSLMAVEERLDISTLLSLLSGTEETGGKDGKGGKGEKGGKDGKGGKGKEGKDGKGKGGKEKGKGGKKDKGKGEENTDSPGSSPLDTFSSILSNFGILGQIIQAVLNVLTGTGRSLNPLMTDFDSKTTAVPLPNPVTDPLGFIQNPLITAILQAILAGDVSAMMKAQGDLAGALITQFVINTISG